MLALPPVRRLTLTETWDILEADGIRMPRKRDRTPFVPPHMPQPHDSELGFSWFKEGWEEGDFNNLTLPRMFIGRSRVAQIAFCNTDLSESRFCWNDFEECDFTDADLHGADLRSSLWLRCRFENANLSGADLRHSQFTDCVFNGALLTKAVLTRDQVEVLPFTEEQRQSVIVKRMGAYPSGG